MGYRLIKGELRLSYQGKRHVGSQPDGDSIWFRPDASKELTGLDGRSAKFNGGGFAQLRFEGIDALELHFQGTHQSKEESVGARDFMLREVGFKDVEYSPSKDDIPLTVKSSQPEKARGYILTRSIDPFGRPVSFVFAGGGQGRDGSEAWLDTTSMNRSVNAKLVAAGHAYPAFYTGLPTDLRRRLTVLALAARKARKGLWPMDDSMTGANIASVKTLQTEALWPKLFRRLVSFFKDEKKGSQGFEAWLRADPERDDELWIISQATLGNLHDVIQIAGKQVSMRVRPEDLVIRPR